MGFIIDPKETGIHDLVAWDQCPEPKVVKEATKWKRLLDLIDDASSWGIETLCLDSLTGFQQLCFSYHCHEYFNDDWSAKGFYAFQSGPKNAATRDWPDLLDALTDLNRTGVNIALIGHSQVKSQANPEGADYIAYEPTLDSKLWDITHAWAQGVLFMNYRIVLDEKRGQKTKANLEDSEGRLMYCQHSPAALAKNRFGLPSILELGESQEDAVETFTKAMSR